MTLHEKASRTIYEGRQELAQEIVERQYALRPRRWKPLGDVSREKSIRDVRYHLSYLAEAVAASDPSLFAEYISWAKVLFAGLNFADDMLETTIRCIIDVLEEKIPARMMGYARECLEAGLQQARMAPLTVPSFLSGDKPLIQLAHQYIQALLQGHRHVANQLITDAVEGGTSVKDVYLHVFQPAQREVGRLWQTNRISVAQEHYCTAATQLIMSQLYPRIFSTERIGRTLIATCVGGELHEIGVRMVADFFEMEGWDTYYTGANTPTTDILRALVDWQADVLAISATMTFHVRAVAQLIAEVRASEPSTGVRILVGGYPFNVSPDLWRRVGASGYAGDAQQAVQVANQWVAGQV